MIEIVDTTDTRAVRNKDNLIAFYRRAINDKQPREAAAALVADDYVQHNPLLPDGGAMLGETFAAVVEAHPLARVEIHRIIAVGDWVWAHVNFLNLYSDDPDDLGIAGVDIWKMDSDGVALEHWDVLQPVVAEAETVSGHSVF
ncbi:nuclear transport factor 2 family protein [Nocardioides donggukensis]|uniref:Nuclear transport factor 2 family protein n=1 Tax=Nocardioides donggukensis TaxID=2774019 RepID=A0A927K5P7_9ACTN|nr:nuclear transport factor 2 family protein [Nocardioides donggukensis]MBD8869615.1 nuclear transport factor 2 family protein [Nocardioides donggukensis]